MYELYEVTFNSTADWDRAISSFDSRHFYHLGAWLDFIEETQPVARKVYGIYKDSCLVGYLPGFILLKGPVRIFGSPFPGWTTPYLGPVVRKDVDLRELFNGILDTLRRDRFWHAEIRHFAITPDSLIGTGFRQTIGQTYIAPIPTTAEDILTRFNTSARKAVRRGLRGEIRAITTKDPSFIDHYYDQLREVFAKDNIKPTYSKERVRTLWSLLMPTGRMLPTMVMEANVCIATRIDFCGDDRLHSFGSASYTAHQKSRPNELARYHAMCEGMKRGLTKYDMTGGGRYKAQFGAELVETPLFIFSSTPLMIARELFRKCHQWKIRLPRRLYNSPTSQPNGSKATCQDSVANGKEICILHI